MTKVYFQKHEVFPWRGDVETGSLCVRGGLYYKGVYYDQEIPESLYHMSSLQDFQAELPYLSGHYALICRISGKTVVCTNRIGIYPLFYSVKDKEVMVSDSFELLEQQQDQIQKDDMALMEFVTSQMTIGDRTFHQNIRVLQAGQYAVIDENTHAVEIIDYDLHIHTERYTDDEKWLIAEHNRVVDDVFQRMINSLRGRKVLLFLSGGYDSRLVATQLKKLNYQNVLCVSFAGEERETQVAQAIAEKLGFEWKLVTAKQGFVCELLRDDDMIRKYWRIASNGFRIPYLESIILKHYIDNGEIPSDCVIINGNSGDLIEGDQFCKHFLPRNTYHRDELIDQILDCHFYVFGLKLQRYPALREIIKEELGLTQEKYSYEQCQEIFERFNWRQRQSKYVVNSYVECEEILQTEWRLPLWDDALVDYWLNVPIVHRAYRNLYYKIVSEERLPTANVETAYLKIMHAAKKFCLPLVHLLYPVRKMMTYILRSNLFYPLGWKELLKIISYTKGNRTNVMTAEIYVTARDFYPQYFGDIDVFLQKYL